MDSLTVESLEPEMMTLSSYCRQRTDPVCPLSTRRHDSVALSHILMVLSLRPLTILLSSY